MFILQERLRFTFWNCGLTPPKGKNKADSLGYTAFNEICDELLPNSDIIGLCEVGKDNLEHIQQYAASNSWEVLDLLKPTNNGGSYFDHVMLYNPSKISVGNIEPINTSYGTSIIKSGIHVELSTTTNSPTLFDVFISHWPSRLRGGDYDRESAASGLRNYIDSLSNKQNVICMGDYNDSPFSQTLNVLMHSTKCYEAIQARGEHTLYNPFWKLSVSQDKYTYNSSIRNCNSVGTYRYRSNSKDHLNWYSFDQILLSGSFLGNGAWHLDEPSTKIFSNPVVIGHFNDSSSYVDHIPVTMHIIHP